MEPNHKIIPANLVKRTVAGLLDFVSNFLITMSLFAFIALPISNRFFSGNELGAQIIEVQLDSYLFIINEATERISVRPSEEQPEAIYRYYMEADVSPAFTSEDIEVYYADILGKNLSGNPLDFSQPISSFTPWDIAVKTGFSAEDVDAYYRIIYQRAIADFELSDSYLEIADRLNLLTTVDLLICLSLSTIIIYVIVPLFTKNGKTFGKTVMKLAIVNTLGYQSEKSQLVFRNVTSVLFNYVGALFLLPFASYIAMIFTKKKQNLIDLFAATMVIDEVNSIIYVNAAAQEAYEQELATRLIAVETKRKKVVEEEEAKKLHSVDNNQQHPS